MKRLTLLFTMLLCIPVVSYAQLSRSGKTVVQARMNYFVDADKLVEIIIAGNEASPILQLGDKTIGLQLHAGDNTTRIYSFPVSNLVAGDNKGIVSLGEENYGVNFTLLPQKDNGVRIDYLTGMIHTDELPFVPCGFYCYSPVQPTLAEEEVVRGINLMSPYQNIGQQARKERIAYLDRCAALGMKVNYNLLSIAGGGGGAKSASSDLRKKRELLREEIRIIKDHPALLSWYVADEPEGQGISVETLEEVYQIVREEDPYHPVSLVIMSAKAAVEYAHTCDIIMLDHYPVPNSPAHEVIDYTQKMFDILQYQKAIWYVPQTFGGAEWWAREPTAAEIRMMTWGTALEGARGFQGFIRHGLNGFPKNQYMWETYTKTCRELQELTPFFDRGSINKPTIISSGDLIAREYTLGQQSVVVIVNKKASITDYKLILKDAFTGNIHNLTDNSKKQCFNGTLDGVLSAYGVEVLKIYKDKEEEAAFLGNNQVCNTDNLIQDPSFEWEYSLSGNVPAACYGKVGKDKGATFAIDSRVAYHGMHSLRMINPAHGKGATVQFYPPPIQLGKTYVISVWAKAKPSPLNKNKKSGKLNFRMSMGGITTKEFTLTDQWERYEVSATYNATRSRWALNCSLELIGEGTAWFDLVEVVPDMDMLVERSENDPKASEVIMNNYIQEGKIH
ncbi:hypothetical protein LJC38_05235 [Parabacteroides sp. OttesenSCG-928-K15]|nr:hypothetical protein [Parabacteroides sp. OttesenSCG-928-K15]